MPIRLDDPRPPYLQVADDLRQAIERGDYEPGDRLPSRRQLAADYEIATKTAQHALDHLQDQGLAIAQHGRGVFVLQQSDRGTQHETDPEPDSLEAKLDEALRQLAQANARLDVLEGRSAGPEPDIGPDPGPAPEPPTIDL
jgi:DNA-binding GntR family transcriptional regulator